MSYPNPHSVGWGFTKPPTGTPIDWTKPINVGLRVRVLMDRRGGFFWTDATGRYQFFANFPGVAMGGAGPFNGPALFGDGASYGSICTAGAEVSVIKNIGGPPFTVSGWIYVTDSASGAILFSSSDTATTTAFYLLSVVGTTLVFRAGNGDATTFSAAASTKTANLRQWYHLVGVWESASSRKVYVDGVLQASDSTARTTDNSLLDNTQFLALHRSDTSVTSGRVDNIAIYNRALSPGEILWLRNNPFGDLMGPSRRIIPTTPATPDTSQGRMFATFT